MTTTLSVLKETIINNGEKETIILDTFLNERKARERQDYEKTQLKTCFNEKYNYSYKIIKNGLTWQISNIDETETYIVAIEKQEVELGDYKSTFSDEIRIGSVLEDICEPF